MTTVEKLVVTFLVIFAVNIFSPDPTLAIYDPLSVPNNKFGIHIIDENDLDNAAALFNSSGGDWGYATIVIPENERNVEKWNSIFVRMQKLHIIPIVRLATHLEGRVWTIPEKSDAYEWAAFLSSLPWPTKNRYIVLFNEPNHAKEWGGKLDPEGYAQILATFSSTLKAQTDNFFILPAGMDASAPNGRETMDEAKYLSDMKSSNSEIFDSIDGWTSHSYPNPGFVGTLTHKGKGTIRSFEWELTFLISIGVNKEFPIFITETGWPYNDGTKGASDYYSTDSVNDLIVQAAESVWNDKRIVAVTPFVLNYQSYPFSQFSWQVLGTQSFHPQFDSYRSLPKVKGQPILLEKYTPTPMIGFCSNSRV